MQWTPGNPTVKVLAGFLLLVMVVSMRPKAVEHKQNPLTLLCACVLVALALTSRRLA